MGDLSLNLMPKNVKMNVRRFKIALSIPLIYFISTAILMQYFYNIMHIIPIWFVATIIALYIFSFLCVVYCMLFSAQTFKSIFLGRETNFSEYADEFFLIWIYPVGIWFLQPRINKMVEMWKYL